MLVVCIFRIILQDMKCPLCHQESHQEVKETISLKVLRNLYRSKYSSHIEALYPGETLDMKQCGHCDLIYFNPMVSGDEAFYNSLQHQEWYYVEEKPEFHRAAELIPSGAKILETGSGKGNFSRFLKDRNVHYTGLDFSIKAKEMAAQEGTEILNQSIQEHSEQHAEKYDVACSFQVLEHVEDIHGFLAAQVNCLKPGGLLLVGVPAEDSYVSGSFDLILNLPPHHLSRWTDQCLHSVAHVLNLEFAGLWHDPLQKHHYFDYAYTLILTALRKTMGLKYKSLDPGFFAKILKAKAWLLGWFLAKGLHSRNLPYGHTVVVAYRKPL